MSDIVEVLNVETGERGQIRRKLFDNTAINDGILVEVDASQKAYVRELFRSRLQEPAEDPADEDSDVDDSGDDPDTEDED